MHSSNDEVLSSILEPEHPYFLTWTASSRSMSASLPCTPTSPSHPCALRYAANLASSSPRSPSRLREEKPVVSQRRARATVEEATHSFRMKKKATRTPRTPQMAATICTRETSRSVSDR